ncbi:MAG: PH domain-containing protein [Planctomycetota bacterium]|nr:PH domain-containing protein [Planctomycetota bacterium]
MESSGNDSSAKIEWRCDACDRAFPVDADADRVPCPYCGDVNRIATAASNPRPRSAVDPPRPATGEQVLRTVRPALVRGHPLASLGSIGLLVGGMALAIIALTGGAPEWTRWLGLIAALGGLGWGLWLFVLGHRWDRLKITSHRTIDERGIVMRSTSEVLHAHVRNIRITQTVWQRIVGLGDLEIDSAAGDGTADIRIADIPDPDGIKRLIDDRRGLGSHD